MSHVLSRALGTSAVLLDRHSGISFRLNDSAALIWRLLEEGHDQAGIAERVAEAFRIPADRAASDVEAFLHELDSNGLLDDA